MHHTNKRIVICWACLAVITTTGCASMLHKQDGKRTKFGKVLPWVKDRAPDPYPNPARMATTWTPDTLMQPGRTPTRGFGGRLFFYDENTHAVPVDGELTVHAFSEPTDGTQGEVKRYVFTSDQFTGHFSQTDLGASYSVWIPWDAVGGDQQRITLVPSFKSSTTGKIVQGEQAVVGLPGRRPEQTNVAKTPSSTDALLAKQERGQSGLVTTTIPKKSPTLTRPAAANELMSFPAATSVAKLETTTHSFPVNLTAPPASNATNATMVANSGTPADANAVGGLQSQSAEHQATALNPPSSRSATHFQRYQMASARSAKTPLYSRPHPQRLGMPVVAPESTLGSAELENGSDRSGQVQPASANMPVNPWQR